jgi:cytochrome d ubiquinol oxidase subunit II
MELTTVWFALIAVLWIGYFCLEGFDFGVGMLLPVLGRTDVERRVMYNTVGPVWDGNEVWVLVAGGATFAAFPEWYATLFSGFYLPLLLILLALIVRNLAFEYRSKKTDPSWRRRWDLLLVVGSYVPAVLWGVAFANIVAGVPIDAHKEYTGNLFTLLNPYGLLGGLTTALLFATHGALFLGLKTDGEIRHRARGLALRLGLATAVVAVVFLGWTQAKTGNAGSAILFVLAAVSLLAGLFAATRAREGWAFLGTAATTALAVAGLFVALFPDVMPSSTRAAWSLTTTNASATHYTLTVMTWVAVVMTPVVLVYQGWTYWVFRHRIAEHHIPVDASGPGSPAPAKHRQPTRVSATGDGR